MPPRKRATPAVRPATTASGPPVKAVSSSALTSGAAVLLADGGEAIFLAQDGESAVLRAGTGHNSPLRVPLEGLVAVETASETERHAKFRADALRRGEIGS